MGPHGSARHHHGPPVWRPRRSGRFLQPIVLLTLLDGPTYGYELIKRASESPPGRDPDAGGAHPPDAGGIYRTLRGLEREGFVRSSWEPGESGPARRRYEITAAGQAALDEWIGHLRARRDALADIINRYESRRKGKE